MNARMYYLVRIGSYAAVLLTLLVMLAWKGQRLDQTSAIGLSIFGVVMAGLIVYSIWRLRGLAPETQVHFGPRPEVVRAAAEQGSRQMPLMSFLVGGAAMVGSYYYLLYQHRGYPVIVIFAPVLFLLGLAGTIHPPIFYAMRNDVGEVQGGKRAIAYLLSVVGLANGGLCAWWMFWR